MRFYCEIEDLNIGTSGFLVLFDKKTNPRCRAAQPPNHWPLMKILTLLLSVILATSGYAQVPETYYDYYWKPCKPEDARYIGFVEKTDSGWLRSDYYVHSKKLQMRALYADADCKVQHGDYAYYHANGVPSSVGRKLNNREEGVCMRYYSNGMVLDSSFYRDGQVVDTRFRWHQNGYPSDSIHRINNNTFVQVGWFDNGTAAYAGFLVNDAAHRKWKYFHPNGQLSAAIEFDNGEQVSAEYYDETGKVLTDTSEVNREANFKTGDDGWRRYLVKKLRWPRDLQFATPASVTIGVTFTIDEDGKVIDAEVTTPFHKVFDELALKIIQESPAWKPAMVYNRRVKAYRVQPLTFVGE
jgi:antitoxin component YwqK of YwqJK toxin-antitoxin module